MRRRPVAPLFLNRLTSRAGRAKAREAGRRVRQPGGKALQVLELEGGEVAPVQAGPSV